jgi:hypothetical protein
MQKIYHKRNELLEVESFKDKEYTEAFDILTTDAKCLYIDLVNGDVTPIITLDANPSKIKVYTGYCPIMGLATTLDDITVNLSKYIPEDNAVLFLSEQDMEKYKDYFPSNHIGLYINDGKNDETFIANNTESLINGIVEVKKRNATIFLKHGTQSEIQKANEVGKELQEKYSVKEMKVFALHCFKKFDYDWRFDFLRNIIEEEENAKGIWQGDKFGELVNNEIPKRVFINKIITTNSTGILKPQNISLQVIDCKEILEEYLNENNLI